MHKLKHYLFLFNTIHIYSNNSRSEERATELERIACSILTSTALNEMSRFYLQTKHIY